MGGKKSGGISTRPAGAEDLSFFDAAEMNVAQMRVPILYSHDDAGSHLYVASFDGTGHDVRRVGEAATNVGAIHRQVEELMKLGEGRIAGGYVPGPGTQPNPLVRIADGLIAFSYSERITVMYREFADQAHRWLEQSPGAEIHIASIGYSRGATLIPGFARLVEQYGILDPTGLSFHKDANGELVATSPRPPLVPPGQTAHAVALFDPVSTSLPKNYDLRLPSSVISGYSLLAADERRRLFSHTTMIGDGVTPDGRFGRSTVAGSHSDVGGGYRANGLEIRSGNVMVGYLNALMDRPLLSTREVPADPTMSVIHRSEQAMFGLFAIGASEPGERYVRERLCVVVDPCTDAMSRDEALAARFEYRSPSFMPMPTADAAISPLHDPKHRGHALFRQALDGVHALDARLGREPDAGSERLAAALAATAAREGLRSIDHVVAGDSGRRIFAVQGVLHDPAQRRAWVDTVPALAQSLAESARQLESPRPELSGISVGGLSPEPLAVSRRDLAPQYQAPALVPH
ncbi:XVIPCD domain-containing protein [Luteimonas sp. MJ250]|uniref:XVIPCD domain-containing protein n=1 Tax=Luteimonas sp. MJ250 TaxID=3129236 RepID=UPI0031BBB859